MKQWTKSMAFGWFVHYYLPPTPPRKINMSPKRGYKHPLNVGRYKPSMDFEGFHGFRVARLKALIPWQLDVPQVWFFTVGVHCPWFGGRLHVVEFYGKCRGKYTIHGWYGKGWRVFDIFQGGWPWHFNVVFSYFVCFFIFFRGERGVGGCFFWVGEGGQVGHYLLRFSSLNLYNRFHPFSKQTIANHRMAFQWKMVSWDCLERKW